MLVQKERKKRILKKTFKCRRSLCTESPVRSLQVKVGTECRAVTQGHYHKAIKQVSFTLISYLCIFPLLLPPLPPLDVSHVARLFC